MSTVLSTVQGYWPTEARNSCDPLPNGSSSGSRRTHCREPNRRRRHSRLTLRARRLHPLQQDVRLTVECSVLSVSVQEQEQRKSKGSQDAWRCAQADCDGGRPRALLYDSERLPAVLRDDVRDHSAQLAPHVRHPALYGRLLVRDDLCRAAHENQPHRAHLRERHALCSPPAVHQPQVAAPHQHSARTRSGALLVLYGKCNSPKPENYEG